MGKIVNAIKNRIPQPTSNTLFMPMVIVFGSTSESCVMISGCLKGRPIDTVVTVTQKGRNFKVQNNYRFFFFRVRK